MNDQNIKTSLERIINGIETVFNTKTVVGDPITIQDATIVPLIEITYGMGIGDFDKKDAGGMGMRITPVACLVVQKGITKLIHIRDTDPLTKLIELLPDLINDVLGQNDFSKQLKEETKKIQERYIKQNIN